VHVEGMSVKETSRLLRISDDAIYEYIRKYQKGKITELRKLENQGGIAKKLKTEEIEKLIIELKETSYSTAKEVCEYVLSIFQVKYHPNAMAKLLNQIGFRYKKTKGVPSKADKKAQEKFLEEVLTPMVNTKGKPSYFVDSSHVKHNAETGFYWGFVGEDHYIKQNTARHAVHINGAYCMHSKKLIYRDEEYINKDAMIRLLEDIRKEHASDIRINVILDNAGYNQAYAVKDYAEENNMQLIYLPPYSPNLNLIERVWKLLKKHVVYNKYFEKFSDFKSAIYQFFEKASQKNHAIYHQLNSLMALNFHILDI